MEQKKEHMTFSWIRLFRAIKYFLAEEKKRFLFFFVVLLLIFFYDFVPVYVVGKMVDFFSNYHRGDSLLTFYLYATFVGASWIIASMVRLYAKKALNIMGQRARTRARTWGFERLTEFSLGWHTKENTGSKIQKVFTGADGIRNFLNILRKDLLKIIANISGCIIAFAFVDWRLIALVMVHTVVFLFVEFRYSKKVFQLTDEFNKINQSAGGVYVESANNMLSIKALGGEQGVIDRVTGREMRSQSISIQKANANNFKWRLLQVVNGTTLGVFLLVLGNTLLSELITVGMVLVLFTYFRKLQDALTDISDLHTDLLDARSDVGHMMPIFEETEFVKTGDAPFPKEWNGIEMKNATMNYGSGQMGLNDFNLTLPRNKKMGIAGLSGSGKSTLAKILLGLYAIQSGRITIGKEDYYSIAHKETLHNITVVLQETELFNLSLEDNVTMMRPLDPVLLETALEISQLKEVVARLPEGLDAKIGEKGYMLSGGERQRLGIARAIYKNAPIIILDEATSSLDSETEGKIMAQLLGDYGKDKTFLIIAHRLGTLKYTDTIAVVSRGKVVEEGSYNSLMDDTTSVFHRMNTKQHKEKVSKKAKVPKSEPGERI